MPTPTVPRILEPIEQLFDALTDPARRERTVAVVLTFYAAAWAVYATIAKGSQDINSDMGEEVAWSRNLSLGGPEHPPMAAWLVRIWFSVFPLTDWSYYLLASVIAAVALWIAWRVAAGYLDAEKRVIGLAMLTLVPFFNFHAFKYNANVAQLPFWGLTTWWFLRSFELRNARYGAFAGIAAACAMLCRSWSIVLLAGLGLAALLDPRRRGYLRSAAPWAAISVGVLAFAPHLIWTVVKNIPPFGSAVPVLGVRSALASAETAAAFLAGAVGYVALPVGLTLVAARPTWSALADTLWPTPPRRLAGAAFAAPLLLAAAAAIVAGFEIDPLWAMPAMTLLPVVLLSSPQIKLPRKAAVRIVALAVVFPFIMIAASPVIAIVIFHQGVDHYATQYRRLAIALDVHWNAVIDKPMRFVGSYINVLNGVVFYIHDRPSTLDIMGPQATPWADEASVARDGVALVCPAEQMACMDAMTARAAHAPAAKRIETGLGTTYFGIPDRLTQYVIVIIPPQQP